MSGRTKPQRRDPKVAKRVRMLAIATLPVVALAAIIALKLVAMMIFAQFSIGYAQAGDFKSSLTLARWNLVGNVVEPWRAWYNVGTAELGLGLVDDSRTSLTEALRTAPLPEACQVRTNLALAIEGQGDVASRNELYAESIQYYAQSAAMLANMPADCAAESDSDSESESESDSESESEGDSGGGGGGDVTLEEQSAESTGRLEDKSEQAQSDLEEQQREQQQQQQQDEQEAEQESGGGGPDGTEEDGEGESSGGSPIDDLGDRLEEAEADRADWDSVDRSQNAPFSLPNKPW